MAQEFNKKYIGTEAQPRVSVFRSNKAIYAQVIDDKSGTTIVAASSLEVSEKKKPVEIAMLCGKILAKKALDKKVSRIIFDRNGYQYHGRVKALAEGMREGGLVF
jgi:large subunit ribosomal protein L18